MRLLSTLFALLLFCGTATGQFKVPEAAKAGFGKKYPEAEFPKWKSAKDGVYFVDFKADGEGVRAGFDEAGKWVNAEVKIDKESLPAAVQKVLERDYANFEVDWVKKLSSPAVPVAYRVALDQEGYTVRVNFSPEGKVLEKEEERD